MSELCCVFHRISKDERESTKRVWIPLLIIVVSVVAAGSVPFSTIPINS